jgi:hypothetical protein
VPALTANIFAVATIRTNKTKNGRIAGHLSSLPKWDIYGSITMFSSPTFIQRHDIKHNDTQQNDTQHKNLICDTQHNNVMLSVAIYFIAILKVNMLNVIMLSVVAPHYTIQLQTVVIQ